MSCLQREYIDNIGSHGVLQYHLYWSMKNSSTSRRLWFAETVWSHYHHNHTKHLLALANWHLLHLNEWTRMIFTACTMTITPLQGHMEVDSWLIKSTVLISDFTHVLPEVQWAANWISSQTLWYRQPRCKWGPSQHHDTSMACRAEPAHISLLSHAA